MVIALALICMMVCSIDVQLYLERKVVANTVTRPDQLNRQGNYFNMSIRELMNVVVVDTQCSFLLGFPRYCPDEAQQPA